jgi:hypothetical protein
MITLKLKSFSLSAGCTRVLYESDRIANLKIDQYNQSDIVGLILQPNEIVLEVKANAIAEHFNPIIIEVLQQAELEGAAEDNEVKLQLLLDVCKKIILYLINSQEFSKIKAMTVTKIQETKYDANVIGWSMPLDLYYLKNENKNPCL